MKELSIEEKVKRYDEAIKVAQRFYNNSAAITKKGLENIFPELKESDDEKVRKEILEFFSQFENGELRGVDISSWIAYLEKQGEKETKGNEREIPFADKVEPKFKVGDFIVNDYCMGRIVEITNDAYLLDTEQGIPFSCQSTRLWDITKDAKDGDVLATDNGGICIFDGTVEEGKYPFAYCGVTECGFEIYDRKLPFTHTNIQPATKGQRDQLEKAMADAGYTFDFEKKELKKIEQKLAWSEEDDDNLSWLVEMLLGFDGNDIECYKDKKFIDKCKEVCKWLKAIKDRTFPQPKQEWGEEDEKYLIYNIEQDYRDKLNNNPSESLRPYYNKVISLLKSRIPQIDVTDEELAEAKKEAYNEALGKIEYHNGEPTFDDGWSAAIWYLKKRNGRPQNAWKPSKEQMTALMDSAQELYACKDKNLLLDLYEQLKAL